MNNKEYIKWCKSMGDIFTDDMHMQSMPFQDALKTRTNVFYRSNYVNPSSNYYAKTNGKTKKLKI